MTTNKRLSSKQKLDSVLDGFEKVVDIQNKHNQKVGELLNSINSLGKKMDRMIDLLQKAGEVQPDKEWPKEREITESEERAITFSDL